MPTAHASAVIGRVGKLFRIGDVLLVAFAARTAPSRLVTYPLAADLPARLSVSHEVDRWIGSADGHLYGWGLCAKTTEAASDACNKEHGIVNNVVE